MDHAVRRHAVAHHAGKPAKYDGATKGQAKAQAREQVRPHRLLQVQDDGVVEHVAGGKAQQARQKKKSVPTHHGVGPFGFNWISVGW